MSKELYKKLKLTLPAVKVKRLPTKYAGHAWELARYIANTEARPLIISASGDGGYNEVVNGVMEADNPHAICAVLPAGNANDHSRTMQDHPLSEEIKKGKVTQLDLIKVTAKAPGSNQVVRYAHSYVGLGLTPVIATELNKHTLNAFKEIILVVKTFYRHRPFKIKHRDKILRLDSLLFANINQMAKVLTLAPENRPDDGKFEVITFLSGHKRRLIRKLAKAAVSKLNTTRRQRVYKFTTFKKMPMQLDGEVMELKGGSTVTVECMHKALTTIV